MQTQKMSLATIQDKLSRAEMKNIMAGDEGEGDLENCPPNMSCDSECPHQTSCKKESHLTYCACYTT